MTTVLVVEDDEVLRNFVGAVLRDSQYAVAIADNGQSALDSLDTVSPDLVLSDLMMPTINGKELALKMQADPAYRNIPVILITAQDNIPELEQCRFVAVLRKPFDISTLLGTEEARRITERIEWHYTPEHGSWLNMAEIELSALGQQCLDRRIPGQESLAKEVAAWERGRNNAQVTINWQFTTADARIKLRHLYPTVTI
jgi:CheY-like chemotaxis protein